MKSLTDPADKIAEVPGAPERGYAAWKRTKVERGLDQARDREAMIPATQLLRDLGLER